jgi:hypothetical protein
LQALVASSCSASVRANAAWPGTHHIAADDLDSLLEAFRSAQPRGNDVLQGSLVSCGGGQDVGRLAECGQPRRKGFGRFVDAGRGRKVWLAIA